jgi:hypothetical protein
MKNVIFYSDYCNDSARLRQLLSRTPFQSAFMYISVDGRKHDPILQALELEYTPTAFVSGQMLVGRQVFDWVKYQSNLGKGEGQDVPREHEVRGRHSSMEQGRLPVAEPMSPPGGARQANMPPMRPTEHFQAYGDDYTPMGEADGGEFAPLAAGGASDFADFSDGPGQLPDPSTRSYPGARRHEPARFPAPKPTTKGEKLGDGNMQEALERLQEDRNRGIPPAPSEQRR